MICSGFKHVERSLVAEPVPTSAGALQEVSSSLTRAFEHHQQPGVRIARLPRASVRVEAMVIVALSFLSLAGPLLVCEIPPLTDYPNHLARYWLIAGGLSDPALAHFYQVDWANAVTNVGVDRVIAWL